MNGICYGLRVCYGLWPCNTVPDEYELKEDVNFISTWSDPPASFQPSLSSIRHRLSVVRVSLGIYHRTHPLIFITLYHELGWIYLSVREDECNGDAKS